MRSIALLAVLAAAPAFVHAEPSVREQVEAADSALFRAVFDDCDPDAVAGLVTDDFEFYHDKWGQTARSKDDFVKAIRGLCERQRAGTDFKARRVLVPGSLQVFPMKGYGALEMGRHDFFKREEGKPDVPTEHALFANLWKLDKGRWLLARTLSYDHVDEPGLAKGRRAAAPMTFFVTSVGLGAGANLGGLEGADRHCQELAAQAGAGSRTWHAYLSTQSRDGAPMVNARDRIGNGPWHNAAGVLIARDVEDLHGPGNNISAATALDEKGEPTSGRVHDILTGTRVDGYAPSRLDADSTCGNWTRNGPEGGALVGHFDRASAIKEPWAKSWNSAHLTRGCNAEGLAELGSGGLFYCFAR